MKSISVTSPEVTVQFMWVQLGEGELWHELKTPLVKVVRVAAIDGTTSHIVMRGGGRWVWLGAVASTLGDATFGAAACFGTEGTSGDDSSWPCL